MKRWGVRTKNAPTLFLIEMEFLDDYKSFPFTHDGTTLQVFRKGSGPGVLIMHELPGMTPECLQFAGRVVDAGYTVFLPLMFGRPGEHSALKHFLTLCVSREFKLLAKHGKSPITDWLRALCKQIYEECGGRGVGAVGMCLTGGFAISMMLERAVLAPVLSEPALPIMAITKARKRALGIPEEELSEASLRAQQENIPVLGLRFSRDKLCPRERFQTLEEHFGKQFDSYVIPSGEDDKSGTFDKQSHAVLTTHFLDEQGSPTRVALEKVLSLFEKQLKA